MIVPCPNCGESVWLEVNDEVTTECHHCHVELVRVGEHFVKASDLYTHHDIEAT